MNVPSGVTACWTENGDKKLLLLVNVVFVFRTCSFVYLLYASLF